MKFSEKKINGKTVYDGKILKLEIDEVQLSDGTVSVRECVRHCGGAAVILVNEGKILLVKQFRYLYGKEIFEIPAGKLEKGEEAIVCAARELEEETGYCAKLVHLLDLYPSVGYTDEIIHVFFAEKFEFVGQKLDKGEFLDCKFVEIKDVLKLIESGEICDAKTVAALYAYLYSKK